MVHALRSLVVAVASLALVPPPVGAVELLPHHASYRMSLASATRGSGVSSAQGVMEYQFGRRCDGWTVENRTYLRISYEGGEDSETVWTFASWESFNGLSFRFHANFQEGGRTVERIHGHAEFQRKGGPGKATLTQPEPRVIELPGGTVFPTAHMLAMIIAAENGERALSKVVFDGASLENPYSVNAVFGKLDSKQTQEVAAATGLPPMPAWWAQMAFFPFHDPDMVPDFELGARYRSDGVTDRITQRFSDFALLVVLNEFRVLPKPDC